MMKNTTFFLLTLVCFNGMFCTQASDNKGQEITLENTSNLDLADKAIIIKRQDIKLIPAGEHYPLLIGEAGDTIAIQTDDLDGDRQWDELFFVINLPAKKSSNLHLSWVNTPLNFDKRTSIRFGVRPTVNSRVAPADSATFYADQLPGVIGYQHYQTDGPTWENDKVAFRLYLDGRNSIDVFGKKVSYMTPEHVGIGATGVTENNYSTMQDWGVDILAVGNSVGIGGISLGIGDSLARLGVTEQDSLNNVDSTEFKILTEGPARSMMQFTYNHWKPRERDYFVQTRTSIWPGMYAFKNEVTGRNLKGDETLLVGLVNSKTYQPLTELRINDEWVALLTHDKQTFEKQWWLGLAIVLPVKDYIGFMEAPKKGSLSTTYLGKLKIENNKPVNYFAIAAWELSDERFKDPVYFRKYVTDFVTQQSAEVKVSFR